MPGLGRPPGEGNDYPLQYSCLKNPVDRPWGCKDSDITEQLILHFRTWPTPNTQRSWLPHLQKAPPTRHYARVWVYPLVYDLQNSIVSAVSNPCASEGSKALMVKWCVQCLPIRGRTGFEPSFSFSLTISNARTQSYMLFLLYTPIHALVRRNALFQQHEMTLHMDITRWSILKSDWLYSLQSKMEKLYTVSINNTMSWLWCRSWTPYCKI